MAGQIRGKMRTAGRRTGQHSILKDGCLGGDGGEGGKAEAGRAQICETKFAPWMADQI